MGRRQPLELPSESRYELQGCSWSLSAPGWAGRGNVWELRGECCPAEPGEVMAVSN